MAQPGRDPRDGYGVSNAVGAGPAGFRVEPFLERRRRASGRFFEHEAERIARLCHRLAERFASGGRLLAFGSSPQERSDVRHVAVEFVHPVIVGKRALPALGLTPDGGPLARQVDLLAEPGDIALAFGADPETVAALAIARSRGCLTVAFAAAGAEWQFDVAEDDPFVHQEIVEVAYHVLWELVHVFFEHRGLLDGRVAAPLHDVGASSFLYPFLGENEHDLEAVVADVRASVLAKERDASELRSRTLEENAEGLVGAAKATRSSLDAGGTLFAFGNGGSATDAMDAVADFRSAPQGWPSRRAIDLTEDAAILTALANDIGSEVLFQRQLIAYARPADVALALSTSGNSANVIATLAEARRRGVATIAMVGYDGGRIASEQLADHVIVTRSQHIPRIQEAQATASHALRELVEQPDTILLA